MTYLSAEHLRQNGGIHMKASKSAMHWRMKWNLNSTRWKIAIRNMIAAGDRVKMVPIKEPTDDDGSLMKNPLPANKS